MRKVLLSISFLFVIATLKAQEIQAMTSFYFDGNKSKVVVVKDDNSIKWRDNFDDWTDVSKQGLPEKDIIDITGFSKHRFVGSSIPHLVVLLSDHTLWWYDDGEWSELDYSSISEGKKTEIREFCSYITMNSSRIVVLMGSGKIYSTTDGEEWDEVSIENL